MTSLVTIGWMWYNMISIEYVQSTIKELANMRYIISGKNIDVTEGLKSAIYDKIGKLEKYFTPETEVHVTLSVEKDRQRIEVTIPVKGNIIRGEQVSTDMYASIDMVQEVIEKQILKYKRKIMNQNKSNMVFSQEFSEDDSYTEEEDEIDVTRVKRFAVKPMDVEEACIQMELLGHNFFVFRNAHTNEVNVVYKRKGNTYGLIEPEF